MEEKDDIAQPGIDTLPTPQHDGGVGDWSEVESNEQVSFLYMDLLLNERRHVR